MTIPKIVALTTIGLGAWLTPVILPMNSKVEGFALTLAPVCLFSAAVSASRESQNRPFEARAREQSRELLATELEVQHELALQERYALLYPQQGETYPEAQPQPQLTGAHLGQPHLPSPGENPGETGDFDLQWLIDSNSSHALIVGDTGSGKTTLARHLIEVLGASTVKVLDADDDGKTWAGFPSVGAGDDWAAIDQAIAQGQAEFNRRQPNGPNAVEVWVFEEMPDLIAETKQGKDFVSRLVRRGRKRAMFALGLTQDPNTGSIELSQPVQKCFTRIFLGGMAVWALQNLAPRHQRQALAAAIAQHPRPAIVEFRGQLYPWAVPTLANAATHAATPAIVAQPAPPTHDQGETVGWLDRCLAATPPAPDWATPLIEWVKTQGGEVTVRQCQQSGLAKKMGWKSNQIQDIFSYAESIRLGFVARGNAGEITGFRLFR